MLFRSWAAPTLLRAASVSPSLVPSLRIFLLSLWLCTPSAPTTPGLQVETPDSRGGGGWALCTRNSRGWVVHPGQESCMAAQGPRAGRAAVAERASQVPREDRAGRPHLSARVVMQRWAPGHPRLGEVFAYCQGGGMYMMVHCMCMLSRSVMSDSVRPHGP